MGSLAASIISTLLYFLADSGRDKGSMDHKANRAHGTRGARAAQTARTARAIFAVGFILLLAASVALMVAFLNHDFSLAYVRNYSSRGLSIGYLISGFWAGQEGTFLLWAFLSAAIGLVLAKSLKGQPYMGEPSVMKFYALVHTILVVLLLKASPFRLLPQVPADGAGLNPLLQDPWMVIHPPIVFIGYALYAVPYVMAMSAMARNEYQSWIKPALAWSVAAWLFLGAGILIGAKWAYATLGWGGYWGWDPVENASLVPWLMGAALLHTLIMQRERGKMVRANIVLSLLSFLLIAYATFLTRSGVLTDFSVHSFADLGISAYLVFAMVVVTVAALIALIIRWTSLTTSRKGSDAYGEPASRDFAFLVTAILFATSAVVTLLGTSAPLLTSWTGNPASVGTSFYNITNAPLGLLIALVMAVCPHLAWSGSSLAEMGRSMRVPAGAGLVLTVISVALGARGVWFVLFLFAAFMALAGNVAAMMRRSRGGIRRIGGWIAHVGVAFILVGIVATSAYSTSRKLEFTLGQEHEVFGWNIKYVSRDDLPSPDGSAAPVGWKLEVSKIRGQAVRIMMPYMRQTRSGVLRHPAILSTVSRDLYIAPVQESVGPSMSPMEGEHAHQHVFTKGEHVEDMGLKIEFVGFDMSQHLGEDAMAVGVTLKLRDIDTGEVLGEVTPLLGFGSVGKTQKDAFFDGPDGRVTFSLVAIDASAGTAQVMLSEAVDGDGVEGAQAVGQESVLLEVSNKPFASLLWIGSILLILGTCVAVVRRASEATAREKGKR